MNNVVACAGVIVVLNVSSNRFITNCRVGNWDTQATTCLLSIFTSSGHRNPQAACAKNTCLSKRRAYSRNPDSNLT
ncbi:hypothetical protein PHMEG_00021966 [Phytophthora megakarya]|uniref:Uncharacterized protein n=1 Tax=Phytophthora megakarya TaxID=4795 RepID=A0A225VJZ3_9STRA|nr:hypothetical protein PHMEG_00021966 [Phytophthora megakarya]